MKDASLTRRNWLTPLLLAIGGIIVVGALVWQALVSSGNPDPTTKGLSSTAMAFSSGILVFREGLEAILVLAAVTAGLVRNKQSHWKSILSGAAAALAATLATWFIVVAVISSIDAPMYDIQAATGLIAIVVLLVVMNWFFHKIYWTGWIAHHSNRRKQLMMNAAAPAFFGMAMLGFTAVYREGFEVVLFLQDLRLKAGNAPVLAGASIGFVLTLITAALTFSAHQKLPYKKMLVLTGGLLALVLVVMVGESAQELQQAHWISTTNLKLPIPDWFGVWFAVFPTVETLAAQALAVFLVVGSYGFIRNQVRVATARAKQNAVTASSSAVIHKIVQPTAAGVHHK